MIEHLHRFKESFIGFYTHDGPVSAGNMAFLTMLSLFPFLIFLVALSGFLGQTDKGLEAIAMMMENFPPKVAEVLSGPISGIVKNTRGEILTFSILIALWTAGSGVEAARVSLIKAFGRHHAKAIWIRRLESLLVVIIAASLIMVAVSVQVIGPPAITAVASLFPDALNEGILKLWVWLKYFVSPAVLLTGLYGVYLALTPRLVKKSYKMPGAIFTLLTLLITSAGLSTYLKYANTYDITYGSLAGVVITQLFCYVVAIGFILGAELNAAYTVARQTKEGPARSDGED